MDSTTPTEPAARPKRLALLRASCFLQMFAFGAIFAFAAVWMRDRGLGEFLIGKVTFASTAVLLLTGIGWGVLADRTGRADLIAVAGCALMAGAMLLLSFCRRPGHFFAYAVLSGLSTPMIRNMMPLLAVAIFHSTVAGRGYGLYRIFGSLGFVIATLGLPCLTQDIGLLLRISAGAMLLATAPLLFYGGRPTAGHSRGSIGAVLRNRELTWFFAAMFFFSVAMPAIYSFGPVYARTLGAGVRFLGLFSGSMGIIAFIALPTTGWAVDRFGPRLILLLAFIAQPMRAFTLSLFGEYQWLLVAQVFHFFTWAGLEVAAVLFITRLAGEGNRATAMSIYVSIAFLGGMAGAPVAGYLAENFGYAVMFRAAAVCAALGTALFGGLLWARRTQRAAGICAHPGRPGAP